MQKKLFKQQQDIYRLRRQYVLGFTLTELVIVIAVSLILLAAGIATLDPAKQINRGNDSRRKTDLVTIQSGLERYFADTGDYPGTVGWCAQISSVAYPQVREALQNYMKNVPKDPKFKDTTNDYYYWHYASRQYRLYAVLENTSDAEVVSGALNADGGIPGCTGANINYNLRRETK